jgi:hypothetical protein
MILVIWARLIAAEYTYRLPTETVELLSMKHNLHWIHSGLRVE